MSTGRPARGRDRGTVLPLVMVLSVALGAVVLAIAKYATASLKYSEVAEARVRNLNSADGALRAAVDQVRSGETACPEAGTQITLPATLLDVNGTIASVTCKSNNPTGAWAAALTGEGVGPGPLLTIGSVGSLDVDPGPVWMTNPDGSGIDGAGPGATIHDAPLVYSSPDCSTPLTVIPGVHFDPPTIQPSCTSGAWYDRQSLHAPPLPVSTLTGITLFDGSQPASAGQVGTLGGVPVFGSYTDILSDCRVYEPGVYIRPPRFEGNDGYFTSGDYYFDFLDPSWTNPASIPEAQVFVGFEVVAGHSGTTAISPWNQTHLNNECLTAMNGDAEGGATFYLSGNAHFDVDTTGTFEIMERGHTGRLVSIQTLCTPGTDGPWCEAGVTPSERSTLNPSTDVVASDGVLVAHGLVYAPRARITSQVSQPQCVSPVAPFTVLCQQFMNGFTVSRATFRSPVAVTGAPPNSGPTHITLTATVDGTVSRMRAIVDYDADANLIDRVRVRSWRVCDPNGC